MVLDYRKLGEVGLQCEDPKLACIEVGKVAKDSLDSVHVPAARDCPEAGQHCPRIG